ncbi:hypothetical protein SPHINGO8AM_170081 [Sphingomonas sp. 8AM]|nr:hypothetical protein SPHINGO8AM_170081 [Sphingomonas sp. 8AM]
MCDHMNPWSNYRRRQRRCLAKLAPASPVTGKVFFVNLLFCLRKFVLFSGGPFAIGGASSKNWSEAVERRRGGGRNLRAYFPPSVCVRGLSKEDIAVLHFKIGASDCCVTPY